jgi:methionine-gamma-lyase
LKNINKFSDYTKSVHAGISDNEHLAVIPPIYQTSTFKFKNTEHGARLFDAKEEGYIYTRMGNPTIKALEDSIAVLENGFGSLGCGSGMAAIHTVFTAFLKKGDHVVCGDAIYGPTTTLLNTVFDKYAVETTFVNTSVTEDVKKAIKPNTKIIYLETPGNPSMFISDIEAIAKIAHSVNALCIVDNTFMSPVLQKPLNLGADVIVHSLTKFLNGHADVVGGQIVAKTEEHYSVLRKTLNLLGGTINPFNAFLVHRGIKTLAIRMDVHCKNAQKIAEFLENHPKIEWVRFPGLKSHPQYEIGKKQTSGPGGMISFELKGGVEAGKILMNSVQLCQLAVSLGGVESLIEHPASMTHASMNKELRMKANISDGLVRLSVGIENVDEIIEDLKNSLNKIT